MMRDSELQTLLERADGALREGRLADAVAATQTARPLAAHASAPLYPRWAATRLLVLFRSGELAALLEEGQVQLPLLRSWQDSEHLFAALRLMATAGAELARYPIALQCAHEAHQLAVAAQNKAREALALNALACCFERMGDPWQGERLMNEALGLLRTLPPGHELFATLNNLGALLIGRFHLLRDARPLDEARQTLAPALPLFEEALQMAHAMGDAYPRVFSQGNLGEVLTHLGRLDEAERHLGEALALALALGFRAQDWRIQCTRGELLLARGDAAAAWEVLNEVLRRSNELDVLATRLRLHHALSQAAARLDRPDEALHHLQVYLGLERTRSVAQLHAQSQMFVTRVEVEQERLESQRQRVRAAKLEADARRDPLTGVGNRREVDARLPAMLAEARDEGTPLALVMLDIDHFKGVNDRFGHGVGDQVLAVLGQLLRDATRAQDLIARVGGEEFLLVLPGTEPRAAREACERLRRRAQSHPWEQLSPDLAVTVSIGMGVTPPYDERLLMARADRALYRAKAEGRNRVISG